MVNKLKLLVSKPMLESFVIAVGLLILFSHTAHAAGLEDSVKDIQTKVQGLCTPLAIIFLVIAGWQKAIGNNFMFIAALTGTLVMFAAPNLVEFLSASFGGG